MNVQKLTECITCGEQGHMKQDCSKAKEKKLVPANLNVVNTGDVACNNIVGYDFHSRNFGYSAVLLKMHAFIHTI